MPDHHVDRVERLLGALLRAVHEAVPDAALGVGVDDIVQCCLVIAIRFGNKRLSTLQFTSHAQRMMLQYKLKGFVAIKEKL